jgi:hypothetical protein
VGVAELVGVLRGQEGGQALQAFRRGEGVGAGELVGDGPRVDEVQVRDADELGRERVAQAIDDDGAIRLPSRSSAWKMTVQR